MSQHLDSTDTHDIGTGSQAFPQEGDLKIITLDSGISIRRTIRNMIMTVATDPLFVKNEKLS